MHDMHSLLSPLPCIPLTHSLSLLHTHAHTPVPTLTPYTHSPSTPPTRSLIYQLTQYPTTHSLTHSLTHLPSGNHTISLIDVLFGDVWFCSG